MCKGDAWIPYLDKTAISIFTIDRTDLGSFTNQLKVRKADVISSALTITDDSYFATYYCDSPTGDFLFVYLFNVNESLVGIELHTDWN